MMDESEKHAIKSSLSARLNGRVEVRDMTAVVEHDHRLFVTSLVPYLEKNLTKAFVIYNTPKTQNLGLGFFFMLGAPVMLLHNDNYATAPPGLGTEKTVDKLAAILPGLYETCSICLEDVTPDLEGAQDFMSLLRPGETLACGHSFHTRCLAQWKGSCPMCRAEVHKYAVCLCG